MSEPGPTQRRHGATFLHVAPIDNLREQVEASRQAMNERRRDVVVARLDEDAAVEAHVALEQALERQDWIEAQRSLGVPDEHIDADRRIVTNLPLGPVHVATGDGIVTHEPDSDEAHAIRESPNLGPELSADRPVNDLAHLPHGTDA